MFSRWETSAGN